MKLILKEARTLLETERKNTIDDRWIEHCISVGDSAGRIAKALSEKGINVDVDKAITLGYLHDIGKYNGESHGHVMRGYEYLKNKGYDDEYANICLTHSYLNNDIKPINSSLSKSPSILITLSSSKILLTFSLIYILSSLSVFLSPHVT